METLSLPTDHKELATVMEEARKAAWVLRNRFLVQCQVAYYYLRGYRRFRVPNMDDGRVLVGYETSLGDLRFRHEDIRSKHRIELGRWLRMDLRPCVYKTEWGLDAIRKASVGQIALDYSLRHIDARALAMGFFEHLQVYGMVGLGHWKTIDHTGTTQSVLEVIPAWELLPCPISPIHETDINMLMRYRMVPLQWLLAKRKVSKDQEFGLNLPENPGDSTRTKLRIQKAPVGKEPSGEAFEETSGMGEGALDEGEQRSKTSEDKMKKHEEWVPLLEGYVLGQNNTVRRYIVKAGDLIVADYDYEKKHPESVVPLPIGIARHTPDLGFYSYGFIATLIPGNHQHEKMLQNLYRNVEELDQYGTVLWPTTAGANIAEFNRKNGRPKVVSFELDYTVPAESKPFTIQPSNTGDFPGRVAIMAGQNNDKIAAQGPAFSGQPLGRMDSGAGLGLAFEIQQISQAATAHQVANCWAQVYKSVLESANQDLENGASLAIGNLEDNIIGLVIDEQGRVTVDDNPLPHYYEVQIDVKDRQPRSKEQEKAEAREMFQFQLLSPTEFRIMNAVKDWGFPMGAPEEFEGYRKAVYNHIRLFNDGQTPGKAKFNIVFDNPSIFLRAAIRFVSRLEFSFASPQVRRSFFEYVKFLKNMLGGYPSPAPDILDLENPMVSQGLMPESVETAGLATQSQSAGPASMAMGGDMGAMMAGAAGSGY